MAEPAPSFAVDRVRAELAGTRFADLRWVARTGSTNADLLGSAAAGEAEGVVLGADHQTAGRGRRGRTWSAPPEAAVLVSVLLRPPAQVVEAVMPAVAVAAVDAVAGVLGGPAPRIKWPNDLVAAPPGGRERKLAGILAEATWPPGADAASGWRPLGPTERVAVVVGMGLNVDSGGRDPELADLAVACDELTDAGPPAREALVVAWLRGLDRWYSAALDDVGRAELWDAWRARSATLGQQVRVEVGAEEVEGRAVEVDDRGRLVVELDDGTRRTLAVGDVTHLRHR